MGQQDAQWVRGNAAKLDHLSRGRESTLKVVLWFHTFKRGHMGGQMHTHKLNKCNKCKKKKSGEMSHKCKDLSSNPMARKVCNLSAPPSPRWKAGAGESLEGWRPEYAVSNEETLFQRRWKSKLIPEVVLLTSTKHQGTVEPAFTCTHTKKKDI